jgi:hypothetical protein
METTKKQKVYFHIIEESNYLKAWHGYYLTLEEAQKKKEKLTSFFPNLDFWIFQDGSKKEPNFINI